MDLVRTWKLFLYSPEMRSSVASRRDAKSGEEAPPESMEEVRTLLGVSGRETGGGAAGGKAGGEDLALAEGAGGAACEAWGGVVEDAGAVEEAGAEALGYSGTGITSLGG